MKNPSMKKIIAVLIFSLLLPGLPLLSTSNSDDSTIKNATYKQRIKTINQEISGINSKLAKIKNEGKSILNDIYAIELKYDKERIEKNKIELQMRDTQAKISRKEGEKGKLEVLIKASKKNLRQILRILYKIGGNTYLKLFIRVDTIEQLFKNYRLFSALIDFKANEINVIKANILKLNQINSQLKIEYTALTDFRRQTEEKLKNIKSFKQGKISMLRKIRSDKKNFLKMIDELKYEAARLDEVIAGKRVKSSLRELNLKRLRGRLNWPLNGKIISSFGKKKSTRFNTYVVNNGIEIRPAGSMKIKSVYSGDVVFADYYKGYGKLVIVQHSRELYTLYGHCEKILKKRGDPVLYGEVIGIVGDTGSTLGKCLYFEIRTKTKTNNPVKWLRKRRR